MPKTMQLLFNILLVISARVLLTVHGQSVGDTITPNISITNGQTLISSGGVFELGFFSPDVSAKHYYIGIWFKNISERTVVWVANREAPLIISSSSNNNSIGVLTLSIGGNLTLVSSSGHAVWSTNTSNVVDPAVRLFDTGNLVLTAGDSDSVLWQSFDYPCDTILAGMKIGLDFRDHTDRYLRSWRSPSDPSPGNYSYRMELHGVPEIFTLEKGTPVYRIGPWTGAGFTNRPHTNKNGLFLFHFTMNKDEVDYSFTVLDKTVLSRAVLNEEGVLVRMVWAAASSKWTVFWSFPEGECDHYATCGPNGICTTFYTLSCDCMQGFAPKSAGEWGMKQFSDGCVRNVQLNCSTDGFFKLQNLKLPDTLNATMRRNETLDGCMEQCRKNCSCVAYVVTGESACFMWFGDLVDLRGFTDGGDDLYIRLAESEIDALSGRHSSSKRRLVIILLPVMIGVVLLLSVGSFLVRRNIRNRKQVPAGNVVLFSGNRTKEDEVELPLFDMMTIKIATKEFSMNNIIGQGGFGPVYKGQLDDGREIAVKRLSEDSIQGLEEFKTEVLLIANLQHRNLVRLLGCCVQDDERMLIYEYMKNKSLDAFIFDETKSTLLDWQKRVGIINGIARGLLYMHQDSRLKIIHRDLKTSNILLDGEMNPKISDFGTARIVKVDQNEGNTSRVIGTYGYMSPEYAMDGIFSTKSDIFSFGVIILEILSGKKNGALSRADRRGSLVGHAWKLWKEGRSLELVDTALGSSYPLAEVLRCIQVGLLCVQEGSDDRPTMAEVVLMLSSKDVALREPNEPGFCKPSTSVVQTSYYSDEAPLTVLVGR